jgi:hypothetical protein
VASLVVDKVQADLTTEVRKRQARERTTSRKENRKATARMRSKGIRLRRQEADPRETRTVVELAAREGEVLVDRSHLSLAVGLVTKLAAGGPERGVTGRVEDEGKDSGEFHATS